jgi:hypothetical protein
MPVSAPKGALSGLAYVSIVEDPARFGWSPSVGAHLGLTPKQYQGDRSKQETIDRGGVIQECLRERSLPRPFAPKLYGCSRPESDVEQSAANVRSGWEAAVLHQVSPWRSDPPGLPDSQPVKTSVQRYWCCPSLVPRSNVEPLVPATPSVPAGRGSASSHKRSLRASRGTP